jgi:glycosyltransferase involved in cell wall biosynthesis
MTRLTGITGFFSPLATIRLLRIMTSYRPDVVHLHELHGYYVNIGPIINYLKKNKIPTLWTYHCEFMYTGKCGYTEDCKRFTSQCGECPLLKDYPKSNFFDFTSWMLNKKVEWLNGFDTLKIITPSKWLQRKFLLSRTNHIPSMVIKNGIDTSVFFPQVKDFARQKHTIETPFILMSLIADFKDRRKGFDFISHIAKKLDPLIYTWIVIGDTQYYGEKPINIIHVPKIKDQMTLASYYNSVNLFVILSKYENLPTVCLEASACGCPIVGWDVGGTSEAILNVRYQLYPYGDLSISNGIQEIINETVMNNKSMNKLMSIDRTTIAKDHVVEYENALIGEKNEH